MAMVLAEFLKEVWCLDPFEVYFGEQGAPMTFKWIDPTTGQ